MKWRLPESLNIGGKDYRIRTDFRDILTILDACTDPELDDEAKSFVMLRILYPDLEQIPSECIQEAAEKAIEFIDYGQKDDGRKKPQ